MFTAENGEEKVLYDYARRNLSECNILPQKI